MAMRLILSKQFVVSLAADLKVFIEFETSLHYIVPAVLYLWKLSLSSSLLVYAFGFTVVEVLKSLTTRDFTIFLFIIAI